MRTFLVVFLLIFGVITGAESTWSAESQAVYISVLPDIPVMDGAKEVLDQSFVFDKAEGKVASTTLFGPNLSPQIVENFYKAALEGLGWKAQKTGVFLRKGEQLSVNTEKVEGGVLVKLALSPELK